MLDVFIPTTLVMDFTMGVAIFKCFVFLQRISSNLNVCLHKSNRADNRGIPDTASSPFDLCGPCHSRLHVLSTHWIPSPFGC